MEQKFDEGMEKKYSLDQVVDVTGLTVEQIAAHCLTKT